MRHATPHFFCFANLCFGRAPLRAGKTSSRIESENNGRSYLNLIEPGIEICKLLFSHMGARNCSVFAPQSKMEGTDGGRKEGRRGKQKSQKAKNNNYHHHHNHAVPQCPDYFPEIPKEKPLDHLDYCYQPS